MTLSELMGHLRCAVLRDEGLPYLWQDAELLRYLNQAQLEFCRRTHTLQDDGSAFTTFDTVIGQNVYELDSRIIFVGECGVVLDDGNGNLSYHDMRDRTRGQLKNSYIAGRPNTYTLQVARQKIRLSPVPDAVYTVRMVVARKPLNDMVQARDEPEIPEDYHLTLCNFAAMKALMNNDPERAQMQAAGEFRSQWDLDIRDAKRYMTHMRSGVSPQARSNWTGKRWGNYF
jgi:hypothetical protein